MESHYQVQLIQVTAMTLEELMSNAPADCQPTVFNLEEAVNQAKEKLAKKLGKKVSELTNAEQEEALDNMPIRDWDIP